MALQLALGALLALQWTQHVGKPHLTQSWHGHSSPQLLNSNSLLMAICSASREASISVTEYHTANPLTAMNNREQERHF